METISDSFTEHAYGSIIGAFLGYSCILFLR